MHRGRILVVRLNYRGMVGHLSDLPMIGNTLGDCWSFVGRLNDPLFVWDGANWQILNQENTLYKFYGVYGRPWLRIDDRPGDTWLNMSIEDFLE